MNNLFVAQAKESAVDLVINSIKKLLLERKLKPGDKLPNELEISEGLHVSRGSVREAMKILSAFGIVDIKVGNGTYISSSPRSSLFDPLLFSFFISNPDITELTAFRKLIEINIVELIITNRDKNKKERQLLSDNIEQLKELQKTNASPDAFAKNDIEFHKLLSVASCNSLAEKIYNFILDYLEYSVLNTHVKQINGVVAYQVHNQIMHAIINNDLSIAKEAINQSVEAWKNLQDV